MKDSNHYARLWKLHNCIDNPKFAKQVATIQADAVAELKAEIKALKQQVEDLESANTTLGWEADSYRDQIPVNHEMGG
jgi:cell division protein FtsB